MSILLWGSIAVIGGIIGIWAISADSGQYASWVTPLGLIIMLFSCSGLWWGQWAENAYVKWSHESAKIAWGKENASTITEAIDKAQLIESDLENSIEKLRAVLTSLNRVSEKDSDYKRWNKMLIDVKAEKEQLEWMLEEAYILHTKYELSPDPDLKKELDAIIKDAEKNVEKYDRLLRTLDEESMGVRPVVFVGDRWLVPV